MTASLLLTPQLVPGQFAGKWVAWTPDGLRILASGDTPEEARNAANRRGIGIDVNWAPSFGVALEWVPAANERFIGPASR